MTRARATQGSQEIDLIYRDKRIPTQSGPVVETFSTSLGEPKESIEVADLLKLLVSATTIDFRRQLKPYPTGVDELWQSSLLGFSIVKRGPQSY